MLHFADRTGLIRPSATLTFNAHVKRLKEHGQDITMFTAGQPDYEPPRILLEATKDAIDHRAHVYTPVLGETKLRELIADYLRKYKLNYTHSEIAVSSGIKLALANSLLILAGPGDEVIYPKVCWGTYIDMINLAGARAVSAEVDENFRVTPETLENVLSPRTKVLILNSPANPTGTVYSLDDLVKIAEFAVLHNVTVISDEIYSEIVHEGEHISIAAFENEVPGIRSLTITANGISKSMAVPGWRMGYVAGPSEFIEKFDAMQGTDASNAPSIVQFGLLETLKDEYKHELKRYFEEKLALLKRRRDVLIEGLKSITLNGKPALCVFAPTGAFYLWVDIRALKSDVYGKTSVEIRDNFLNLAGVGVTEGAAFGNDDYVRFSYAVVESEILRGVEKLKKYIEEVNT